MVGGITGVTGTLPAYGVTGYTRIYGAGMARGRAATPETPVQPVRAAPTATAQEAQPAAYTYSGRTPGEFSQYAMPVLPSSYPAEQANRARLGYTQASAGGDAQAAGQAQAMAYGQAAAGTELPSWPGANAAEALVRMRIQYGPEEAQGQQGQAPEAGAVGAQEAVEEGKCETCEKRKYQDGSDDASVSYQTPTHIDPDMVASAVRGHEMEHVAHEQAKAEQEDRKVVSQTVTLHTDICPECGKTYISGGTTRTVTKADDQQPAQEPQEEDAPAAA